MSIRTVKCPTCASEVRWEPASTYRPFCSERCKLIDLGAWAAEEHVIAGDPVLDEVFSGDVDRYH